MVDSVLFNVFYIAVLYKKYKACNDGVNSYNYIKTTLLKINTMNKMIELQQTAIRTINGGLNMDDPLAPINAQDFAARARLFDNVFAAVMHRQNHALLNGIEVNGPHDVNNVH